ncbi:MAG: HAD family phosphatase [Faecalibacterium sp.]|nr:HAD family phosphatase [Faecalibacterium sp.]
MSNLEAAPQIKVLALDLDGTLTNSQKIITPRTRAALDAAMDKGVTIVLASGRPTVGVMPLAKELDLPHRGGCILSYNGGSLVDCMSGQTWYQKRLPAAMVPELCAFADKMDVAILTYDNRSIVTSRPEDPWVAKEAFINRIPTRKIEDLPGYVNYPISKMLICVDPEKMPLVEEMAQRQFNGRIDVYRSCAFFLEAVPIGVAKDAGLASLLERKGLCSKNLMAVGDGVNDLSMIRYAGVGVAMKNADTIVKHGADYVTENDNDHDGVAEAIEKFILNV